MPRTLTLCSAVTLIALGAPARAGPVTTFTDLDAFLEAAGDVREIDFETLPDGTPSVAGTLITPDFNYTDQGVTFLTPYPELRIGTPPQGGGFPLFATAGDTALRNWIIADFVTPAWAVGIVFPGHTTLSAFDADEELVARISGGGSGAGFFLGIVSDLPIASATGDRGASAEVWDSFAFTPIPEPVTLLLLGGGALVVLRRRRRRLSSDSHVVVLLVAALAASPAHGQPSETYTTTTDFNTAFLNNAEGAPDESDGELRIRTAPQTLPYIWVACTERYTVARIASSDYDPLTQQAADLV